MSKKLIFTKTNIVLEILGYVFLLAAFLVAAVACATIDEIPVQYDASRNIVRYGSPGTLFVLPATMLFCNVLFSLIAHFIRPEAWIHLPFALRPGREIVVYRDAARMLMIMELLFGAFSFGAAFFLFRGCGAAITPLTTVLSVGIFADIAVAIAVSARHNRTG